MFFNLLSIFKFLSFFQPYSYYYSIFEGPLNDNSYMYMTCINILNWIII